MKNICILIPYFGKWPDWFNFFLHTCAWNPGVTWHLFTDCPVPDSASENVKFTPFTLQDFNALASEKLHIDINLPRPYKLCDLRPAYQVIFEDFLHGCDFWGYGDLDVIYGNIAHFITDEILEHYDVITTRQEAMAGHFSLFKNIELLNRLYERSPRYKEIFQDTNHHYAFDELCKTYGLRNIAQRAFRAFQRLTGFGQSHQGIDGQQYFEWSYRGPNDITHLVKEQADNGNLRVYHRTIQFSKSWYQRRKIKTWKLMWDSGILTDMSSGEETMYFHLLASRKKKGFHVPEFHNGLSRFYITKHGISVE